MLKQVKITFYSLFSETIKKEQTDKKNTRSDVAIIFDFIYFMNLNLNKWLSYNHVKYPFVSISVDSLPKRNHRENNARGN